MEEYRERPKIDTSEWKREDLKPPSQPGVEMLRGSHRDAFERRMEAQYARSYAAESAHIGVWAERENLNPIFLFGPSKVVEMVHSDLPKAIQSLTVMDQEDLAHLPVAEFHRALKANCGTGNWSTNGIWSTVCSIAPATSAPSSAWMRLWPVYRKD